MAREIITITMDGTDRVMTPHGVGTFMIKEIFNAQGEYRLGVKHDVYPKKLPLQMYKDDIVFYFQREVEML